MNTLLDLGSCIVALEHIVKAEFTPARAGGEEYLDEDSGQMATTSPRTAKLELTLTSLHLESDVQDYASGYYQSSAGVSDEITVRGEIAEAAASWLQSQAVGSSWKTAKATPCM